MYDGVNPYADFDGSESLTTRYLYGPVVDMILARLDDSGDIAWYLTDHLGSVRDLADTEGSVIDHVKYDSFGNVISESSPSSGDRFKYTGREYDESTQVPGTCSTPRIEFGRSITLLAAWMCKRQESFRNLRFLARFGGGGDSFGLVAAGLLLIRAQEWPCAGYVRWQ